MPFKYVAYAPGKGVAKGTVDADSESMAVAALERDGYRILSLKAIKRRKSREELLPSFFGVKSRDMLAFSSELATLLENGLPLLDALKVLREEAGSSALRKAISGIITELERGNAFSQALSKYPWVFPSIFQQIVRVSEHAGMIELGLRQAVQYMERGEAAKQKVKQALAYPAFLLLVAIGVVVVLLTITLPPILNMLAGFNVELPLPTRMLIAGTEFLSAYKLHLLAGIVALAAGLGLYVSHPSGRFMVDRLFLKLPLFGPLIIKSNTAIIARTISLLMKVGIPITQIMDIVYRTTGNRAVKKALREIHEGILSGQSLSWGIANQRLFPRLLTQMVVVGERTGRLESQLGIVADLYEQEVNYRTERLTGMVGPAMIIVIGLLVGFIALSILLPMFSLMGAIG